MRVTNTRASQDGDIDHGQEGGDHEAADGNDGRGEHVAFCLQRPAGEFKTGDLGLTSQ